MITTGIIINIIGNTYCYVTAIGYLYCYQNSTQWVTSDVFGFSWLIGTSQFVVFSIQSLLKWLFKKFICYTSYITSIKKKYIIN